MKKGFSMGTTLYSWKEANRKAPQVVGVSVSLRVLSQVEWPLLGNI